MTFTTTELVDNRVLVTGTDFLGTEGKTVLDSSQWLEVNKQQQFKAASSVFDKAVEEFFAPLTEAADKVAAATKSTPDPIGFVVVEDAVEGVQAKPAHLIKLTHDSIVLRLLENGQTDRLAWVGDQLEVIASPSQPTLVPADEAEVLQD